MIQFKRGSTESWKKLKKPLAAGQPGYDKDKHKIKVGDGVKLWEKLPYAGLSEEEVLDSEKNAKERLKADPESMAIITYGEESPDKKTVGQLYLQYYDTEPEVDYVVSFGVTGIWTYRRWRSGLAECWGTIKLNTTIQTTLDEAPFYSDNKSMKKISYPFTFSDVPSEQASIQGPGNLVWLATRGSNTESGSAVYSLLSPYKQQNAADYHIALRVSGFID